MSSGKKSAVGKASDKAVDNSMETVYFDPGTYDLRSLKEMGSKLIAQTGDGESMEVPLGTMLFDQGEGEINVHTHEVDNVTEVRTTAKIVEKCSNCGSATMNISRIGKLDFIVVKKCRCGHMIVVR